MGAFGLELPVLELAYATKYYHFDEETGAR